MFVQSFDDRREFVEACSGIPSVVTGELVGGIGDECDLGRAYVADQLHEGFLRISFNIELGSDEFSQVIDVLSSNMSLVGSRVNGNSLRAESFAVSGES